MAAEPAQPADLDLAQRRLSALEADLNATLRETFRLTGSGAHDAAILRLDLQRRQLDETMEALARDLSGLAIAPEPAPVARRRPRLRMTRWIAAAISLVAVAATAAVVFTGDPLSDLAARVEAADRTADPQQRLLMLEGVYDSLRREPVDVVSASSVPSRLADAALRTAVALDRADASPSMQRRAVLIARSLDPPGPIPPRDGRRGPIERIVKVVRDIGRG